MALYESYGVVKLDPSLSPGFSMMVGRILDPALSSLSNTSSTYSFIIRRFGLYPPLNRLQKIIQYLKHYYLNVCLFHFCQLEQITEKNLKLS